MLEDIVAATNIKLRKELPQLKEEREQLVKELEKVKNLADQLLGEWDNLATAENKVFLKEKLDALARRRKELEGGLEDVELTIEEIERESVSKDLVKLALGGRPPELLATEPERVMAQNVERSAPSDWLPGQDSNLQHGGYNYPEVSSGVGLSHSRLWRDRALARLIGRDSSSSSLCTFLPTSAPPLAGHYELTHSAGFAQGCLILITLCHGGRKRSNPYSLLLLDCFVALLLAMTYNLNLGFPEFTRFFNRGYPRKLPVLILRLHFDKLSVAQDQFFAKSEKLTATRSTIELPGNTILST